MCSSESSKSIPINIAKSAIYIPSLDTQPKLGTQPKIFQDRSYSICSNTEWIDGDNLKEMPINSFIIVFIFFFKLKKTKKKQFEMDGNPLLRPNNNNDNNKKVMESKCMMHILFNNENLLDGQRLPKSLKFFLYIMLCNL